MRREGEFAKETGEFAKGFGVEEVCNFMTDSCREREFVKGTRVCEGNESLQSKRESLRSEREFAKAKTEF